MKIAVLLVAVIHTACAARAGPTEAAAAAAATAAGGEGAERAGVSLHCFTCSSLKDRNCGDPFNVTGIPIVEFPGKSVCYKFKMFDYVVRDGMLDADYLQKYEEGEFDAFPVRYRCSGMLCNGGPAPGPGPGAALPLLLLLPSLVARLAAPR